MIMAIVLHEVSHGYVASRLGDQTAKLLGRLTLNPIAHIDLFGTIILPILMYTLSNGSFMFGYAKPVPINPMNFKNPRQGMAISAAAGPVTNIVLAFISFLIMKTLFPLATLLPNALAETVFRPIILILQASIYWNVVLGVLNMIPIPPLDGGRVLTGLLPSKQAMSFSKVEPFGFIIVMILFYTGIASLFIMPVIVFFMKLFGMM